MIVAIVGRPNAGKSTLFNKLTRRRTAIVSPIPGITRDRLYGQVTCPDGNAANAFTVIDTGGFESVDSMLQPFAENLVWEQSKVAIAEADIVLMLFDGRSGIHPHDREILQHLRNINKTTVYAVNKIDNESQERELLWEFFSLGLKESGLLAISAAHSRGLSKLRQTLHTHLAAAEAARQKKFSQEARLPAIALIGRPNAGKSSLLNRIVGENRSIVSPVAGTTRDSIHSYLSYSGKRYKIVDTAGIRRKTKIKELVENQSVFQSINALERADIVVYVVDALEGLKDQDARLLNLAYNRGRAILLLINKWDLVPDKNELTMRDYERNIRRQLGDLSFIPVHFVSSLTNYRVHKTLELIAELTAEAAKRVERRVLEETLRQIVAANPPTLAGVHKRPITFQYIKQTEVMPPTLSIRCNRAEKIKTAYQRYLRKRLKHECGWHRVPIRLILQGKKVGDRIRL